MTDEDVMREFGEKLAHVEERAKSNTRRIDKLDIIVEENRELIGTIKELAVETKHMREDLNRSNQRIDKLEDKGSDKWEKFKWMVLAGVVTIVLGALAVQIGLK